jgi:hypothetical protein
MAWPMMGPMIGMGAQMPEPTLSQKLKYGMSQFFSPENENRNLGLASALLSQSGWHPAGQAPTLGQALGQSLPAYQQGQQLDKQNADEDQLKQLAKQMGFEGLPSSVMPGLVSKMLERQMGGDSSQDIQEYEYAQRGGYKGSFYDWMNEKSRSAPYYQPVTTSTGMQRFNARTGQIEPLTGADGSPLLPIAADPSVQGAVAGAKAEAGAYGKGRGEAQISLPGAEQNATYAKQVIDSLINHPGRDTLFGKSGAFGVASAIPGSDAAGAKTYLDQISGQAFLEAFESLKGAGQITEVEGIKATQAKARLATAQSDEEAVKALNELKAVIDLGVERARRKAGATDAPPAAGGFKVRRKIK